MSSGSYFQPTITIGADNIIDRSGVAGVVAERVAPANLDRIGFILQSHSDTNDLWWGYGSDVAINGVGSFKLAAGHKQPFIAPANGVWRNEIWVISDGGGRFTFKEWTM